MFFERSGPVWETLRDLEKGLQQADIDYIVIGGLALNAYKYPRQTTGVDVVMTPMGYASFEREFAGSTYQHVEGASRRFVDPQSEVTIDVLLAGELAGRRSKNNSVRFPYPNDGEVHEDLRTVSLARLVELKLVTWRFKDWGDVVELIRRNNLPESFTDKLDPIVRAAYGECYDQAKDEEYEGPSGDGA